MTYVSTWSGRVYVAFVADACARRIPGWRTGTTMTTNLVLDALEQPILIGGRDGRPDLAGLVHHHDHGSQYTSLAFGERLTESDIRPRSGRSVMPTIASILVLLLRRSDPCDDRPCGCLGVDVSTVRSSSAVTAGRAGSDLIGA